MSRRRSKVCNQKGFTLIEIIAVLVILGILAAVAIPRFMDLTDEASKKAALQAVAEGKSRLSNQFARNLLTGAGTSVSTIRGIANSNLQSAGDYKISYSASGVGVDQIKVIATGSGVRGSNSGVWTLPQ